MDQLEFYESELRKEYQGRLDKEFEDLKQYPQILSGTVEHQGIQIAVHKYANGLGINSGSEIIFEDFEEAVRKTRQLIDTIKSNFKYIWVRRFPDVKCHNDKFSVVCRLAFSNDVSEDRRLLEERKAREASSVQFDTIQKGIEVTYKRNGTFSFKGIDITTKEAIDLADILGHILTGKTHLISQHLSAEQLKDAINDSTACANCSKKITTGIVFCNDNEQRICQECWDKG